MRGSILIVNLGGGKDANGSDPIRHPMDPSAAVGGMFDAGALLVLWLLRCAVPVLLITDVVTFILLVVVVYLNPRS